MEKTSSNLTRLDASSTKRNRAYPLRPSHRARSRPSRPEKFDSSGPSRALSGASEPPAVGLATRGTAVGLPAGLSRGSLSQLRLQKRQDRHFAGAGIDSLPPQRS